MSRRLLAALAAAAALAAPATASAQIVNVQSLIGDDAEEGVSGGLDASADIRTGNIGLLIVRGAATVRWRRGDHLVFGIVRGEYGKSGSPLVEFMSKSFEHVRYRYRAAERLELEAFAQNEADEFRRLRGRALVGAGPRVEVVDRARFSLHVGVAAMLEYEEISDDGLADAGATQTVARASSYAIGRVEIDERLAASETFYVQPRIDRVRDLRLLSESALLVELVKRASLKLALVVAHDSRPPLETARTDTSFQTGIVVSF